MKVTTRRLVMAAGFAVFTLGLVVPPAGAPPPPPPWNVGDIFVSLNSGGFQVRDGSNPGTIKQTVDAPSALANGTTAACAFDSQFNLYGAYFDDTKIVKFDLVSHVASLFANPGLVSPSGHSRSIVFAANGDLWVSNPDGNHWVHRYSSAAVLLQKYEVDFAPNWMDLASNQQTMFFTSPSMPRQIRRFDATVLVAPPPVTLITATSSLFATLDDTAGVGSAAALRLLPTGQLLVADGVNVKRLNSSGGLVQQYDATGANNLQALNLDPDGVHFWAGDYDAKKVYKFAINGSGSPVSPVLTINLGGSNRPTGICVMGGAQLQIQPVVLKNISGVPLQFDQTARFGDSSLVIGAPGTDTAVNGPSTWRLRVGIQASSGGIGAVSFTPQSSSGACDGNPSLSCSTFDLRLTEIADDGDTPTQCVPFFNDPSATAPYPYLQTQSYKCGQYRTKDLPEGAYVPNTVEVVLNLTNPPSTVLNPGFYGSDPLKGNPRIVKDPRRCDWATTPAQLALCNSDEFIIDATSAVIDWPSLTKSVPTSLADYAPAQRLVSNGTDACANIVKPDNFDLNSGSSIKLIVEASSTCVNGVVQYSSGNTIENPITGANTAPYSMTLAIAGTGTNQTLLIYCGTPGSSLGCFVESQPGSYQTTVQLDPSVIPPDAVNAYVFAVTSVNVPSATPDPLQQNPGLFAPTSRQYQVD